MRRSASSSTCVPRRVERVCLALADVIVFFVSGLIGVASIEFIAASWAERTPILQVPAALIALPLPVGMALMAVYAAERLWRDTRETGAHRRRAVSRRDRRWRRRPMRSWLPALGDDSSIIAALVLFFVAISRRRAGRLRPAAGGRCLSLDERRGAACSCCRRPWSTGAGNYILLAVPFFILAGLVMERGGDQRAADPLRPRAGRPSARRPAAGHGGQHVRDLRPFRLEARRRRRRRHGHARRSRASATAPPEGAAVLAVSAIMGETVPPSIAMLIVGSITNVSVAGHVHRRPDARGGDRALPDGADRVPRPSRRRACPLLAPRSGGRARRVSTPFCRC